MLESWPFAPSDHRVAGRSVPVPTRIPPALALALVPVIASFTFAGWSWLLPVALAATVLVGLVAWSYHRAPASPTRLACALLKLLGIGILAFCLLEPLWSSQRARPGANLFAIVADDSRSLQLKDQGGARSRGEVLRDLLDFQKPGWQPQLASDFELRRYAFANRLRNVQNFQELAFDGRASSLGAALRSIAERFRGRPLAGVLLFTDGNATDLPAGRIDAEGLPPVYPVVLGDRTDARDLALAQSAVSQSAFEDAPVTVSAELHAAGFAGERVTAQLVDPTGRVLKEETLSVRRDADALPVRFLIKPERPGLSFYQLRVAPKSGAASPPPASATSTSAPPATPSATSTEITLANNARVLPVDRGRGPYRILYVSGRPNWEFKFMNRAAMEDPQLQVVALIRVARREPRFEFRGYAGEQSNPLFRGFGNQNPEEVERFDQPVLVRLNTRDEVELRSGFPRVPEELYAYDAVILDDLEAAFFTPEQLTLLQRFVSERGGGFLMLGGTESFREGGYHRNPVGDMLPVYLDRAPEAAASGPVQYDLAREGWLEAWARVRDNETGERQRLDAMPALSVMNRVRGTKPGASVIATARDQAGNLLPAVAIQRFGRGRTAAVTLGDLWRWGMRDPASRVDLDKSWRQLLRWLVADVPGRVEVSAEPVSADPDSSVRLEVRVRDARFQPLDDAAVLIDVQPVTFAADPSAGSGSDPANTNTVRLRAEPAATEPGLYVASYLPRAGGGYRATALVTNVVGASEGRAETGWSSEGGAEEFRSLVPNRSLLESIARATRGEVVPIAQLDAFVRQLPQRAAPVMEAWTSPLWHSPWLFALALACLAAEWGLRRWRGLP